MVGPDVGARVGSGFGSGVGALVGAGVGRAVGFSVGDLLGLGVGALVRVPTVRVGSASNLKLSHSLSLNTQLLIAFLL